MLVLPYYCYCYCYYCLFSFSFLIPRTPPLLDNNKTSFFLISPPISMNSSYHSSFPPFSIDLNQDIYYDNQLEPVAAVHASSSSLPSYPLFINPSPQEPAYYQRALQPAQLQDQADAYVSGSFCDRGTLKIKNDEAAGIFKKEEGDIGNQQDRSLKWVSSKVRLVKKMIRSEDQTTAVALPASIQKFDHDQEDFKKIISPPPQPDNNSSSSSSNNNNTTIRVCSDCNTTKTPLWRSGPRGPKSLCNACGIRQRKARRAMAAAAASAAGSTSFGANNTDHEMQPVKANVQIQKKEKKPMSKGSGSSNNNTANHNSHLPFKKRCTQKAARSARKINIKTSKICLEDLTIILSKKYSSSFQQVFPQDEKDAAILLMALSYGALVHG